MKSAAESGPKRAYPRWEDVQPTLGDKVIEAVAGAVNAAKGDLADYRSFRAAWVAQASERGLAAWIHDRLWFHLASALDKIPGVTITDKGVLREFSVGPETSVYRFRVKRHHEDGDVSTYPTELALEFLAQPEGMLEIFGESHLIAGYRWIGEERAMGDAVISLRDGRQNVIWEKELPFHGGGSSGTEGLPRVPQPPEPVIDGAAKEADSASDYHE
jgi:hypothetical protein